MRKWRAVQYPTFRLGLLLGAALVLGCSEETTGPRPVPAGIGVVGGDGQAGIVGHPLDTALTVFVADKFGNAVRGVLVRFTTLAGNGSLSPLTVTTGPDGHAQASWTLPTAIGTHHATAVVSGFDSLLFTATAEAATPSTRIIAGGNGQTGEAGHPLDSLLRVRVLDGYGNPVRGTAVAFQVVSGGGSVGSATVLTDTAGDASTSWLLNQVPGYDTLLAAVDSLPPLVFSASTFPAQRPDSLVAEAGSSCELLAASAVRCWGDGSYTPVSISGLPAFDALTAGSFETCGLTPSGETWCWAAPFGSATGSQVATGVVFAQISFGEQFQCGLAADGAASCRQQVGAFLPVAGNRRWRQVSAGIAHVCGVTRDGRAFCWGDDGQAQLGNGLRGSSVTPDSVVTAERFHQVSAGGRQSCGITADGRLFCWGTLSNGAQPLAVPLEIAPSRRFQSVDAGLGSVCAVQLDGTGYCFGEMASNQTGGLTFRQVAVGGAHGCGHTTAGETWCWGSNASGAIGVGSTYQRLAPDTVVGGLTFASLTTGFTHSCGLTAAGQAWCWGEGGAGQLGNGVSSNSTVPVAVAGGLIFTSLAAGSIQTCGVTTAAEGYCWGPLTGTTVPTLIPGGHSFTTLSVGTLSSCGVTTAGAAVCWGRNFEGQLGDSTTTSTDTPVAVAGGLTFARVAVGNELACGLTTANAAWCWGTGNLGDSTSTFRPYPGPVQTGQLFDRIALSENGTGCAITPADAVWCWGNGGDGQLGDGVFGTQSAVPIAMSGGYLFSEIALANNSDCGRTTAGAVLCWGYNGDGELGDGTGTSSTTPIGVQGVTTAISVATAGLHGCALDAAGKAYCWGRNDYGQLGIGVSGTFLTPVQVP